MKKIKRIILILNILTAVFLIISYFLVSVSPEKSIIVAFIPVLYFIFLTLNILFMIFWIIFSWKNSLISFIAILITIKLINSVFPFTSYTNLSKNGEGELKVMSYNVMVFGLYSWKENTNAKSNIINLIKEENPHIICMQEAFWMDNNRNFITVDSVKTVLNSKYLYKGLMSNAVAGQNFGFATVSKYPIVNSYCYRFEDSFNGFIFNDIVINEDTLRVYNCHLQSIQLDQNDYTLIETLTEQELNPKMKLLLKKFLKSSQKRAGQVRIVKESIDSCKYPVLICGDFNDMPVSYSYSVIRSGLKDSFTSKGKFPGYTWKYFKIKQRIDYILYDGGMFECTGHKVIEKSYSDHYPVVAEFNLKKSR